MVALGTMKEGLGVEIPKAHDKAPAVSAIPPGIREKVAMACRNALETCAVLGALAMSPAAMAGEAPVQKVSVEASANILDIMKSKGFSDISIQSVRALSDFVREKQTSDGIAPTEAVSIADVSSITSDGGGLDQLVNSWVKLERKAFKDVTKQDSLSVDNYKDIVESLFDTSDIDIWLTKTDGTAMSAQEKADYRASLMNAKTRWQAKLPELIVAGKQDIVTKWFAYFNALAQNPIHGSREEYRRGLIAANSMASFSAITPEKQKTFAPVTATQAAEYVFMINPKATNIKIERNIRWQGSLKYMVASDQSLKDAGFSEGAEVNRLAFQKWNEDQAKVYELYVQSISAEDKLALATQKLTESEAKLAGNEAKLAGNEAKLAGNEAKLALATQKLTESEAKLAGNKEELALAKQTHAQSALEASRSKESLWLQDEANKLAKTIMEQLDQLGTKRGDGDFIVSLNGNLQKWKALKQQVQNFVAGDPEGKFLHSNERTSLLALFDTILKTATVNEWVNFF